MTDNLVESLLDHLDAPNAPKGRTERIALAVDILSRANACCCGHSLAGHVWHDQQGRAQLSGCGERSCACDHYRKGE